MADQTMVAFAAVGAIALYFAPVWFRHRARHISQIPHYAAELQQAAVALIDDDTVPHEVVQFVCRLAPLAGSPLLARMIVRDILTGAFFKKIGRDPKSTFGSAMGKMTQPQRELFAKFLTRVLFSSVASDPFFAAILWRIIKWGFLQSSASDGDEIGKAQTIALEVSRARPSLIAA